MVSTAFQVTPNRTKYGFPCNKKVSFLFTGFDNRRSLRCNNRFSVYTVHREKYSLHFLVFCRKIPLCVRNNRKCTGSPSFLFTYHYDSIRRCEVYTKDHHWKDIIRLIWPQFMIIIELHTYKRKVFVNSCCYLVPNLMSESKNS